MKKEVTFGEAFKAMENGSIANREGWHNGNSYPPKTFVFMRPEFKCELGTFEKIQSVPEQAKEEIKKAVMSDKFGACWEFVFLPYLCKFMENGQIENGWMPSQEDMAAKDWFIFT